VCRLLTHSAVSRSIVAIPKSVNPSRITENAKLVDLDEEDIKEIGELHKTQGIKRFIVPPWPVNLEFKEAPWGTEFPSFA
jgi:glycerol 2-dehydrogenase (NADP+)